MGLAEEQFLYHDDNFDHVTFIVDDGQLTIRDEPGLSPPPGPIIKMWAIKYDLNGGTYKGSTRSIVEEYVAGSNIKVHEAPVREGYTFLYWKGSKYNPGDTYKVTEDHVFTAVWQKDESPGTSDPFDPILRSLSVTVSLLGAIVLYLCRKQYIQNHS